MAGTRRTTRPDQLSEGGDPEAIVRQGMRKRAAEREPGEGSRRVRNRPATGMAPAGEALQAELATARERIFARLQADNERLHAENQRLQADHDQSRAENARLAGELQARDQRILDLEAGRRDAALRPDARPAQEPARPLPPRTYYAEPVEVRNPPDPNDNAAMMSFYRAGGYQADGKFYWRPGKDLSHTSVEPYGAIKPREREATPEPQARRHNVNLEELPHRQYFDVQYHDWSEAEHTYGLVKEPKPGSSWENTGAGGVNKSRYRFYSEDDQIKLRAIERWPRYDIETGRTTSPPMRGLDPRQREGSVR